MAVERYRFAPGLVLEVRGNRGVVRHFHSEYGSVAVEPAGRVPVEVEFTAAAHSAGWIAVRGGHKTVRWEVAVAELDGESIRASIRLGGRPRTFALSLVQGYFVEPLLSVAAAHRGYVLLPSAALEEDGGALLLMGRSRSGKSSLSVRGLVGGRRVLGDDQVLLDVTGRCWPFPRRLRFYPDLARTAPGAYARLPRASRAALRLRRLGELLSGGYVRPPVRVRSDELGAGPGHDPLAVSRVVVIERAAGLERFRSAEIDSRSAVAQANELLEEQRAKLRSGAEAWAEALDRTAEREALTLRQALADVPVERLSVPAHWDAVRALAALAERLRLPG
ncbi:MAG: hypothetical protein ACRDON_01920 [Gaiellaceae bacterium]